MELSEARKKCAEDKNYYIAWTYGENDNCWDYKEDCKNYRDKNNLNNGMWGGYKSVVELDRYLPIERWLYMEKCGLERDVRVCKIERN